jgi:hypothetical protein
MAVPRLDPRVNADRIYTYNDYVVLSGQFRRRRSRTWLDLVPFLGGRAHAVRLVRYRVALVLGGLVLTAALSSWAFLAADNARLAYAAQERQASMAGVDQSIAEAISNNKASEAELFAKNKAHSAEVVYPLQMKFITLTNIPEAEGKTLVEQLYPLSSEVIKVAP